MFNLISLILLCHNMFTPEIYLSVLPCICFEGTIVHYVGLKRRIKPVKTKPLVGTDFYSRVSKSQIQTLGTSQIVQSLRLL